MTPKAWMRPKPWLTEYLDLLECPYCRSGEVTEISKLDRNICWCHCGTCARDFRVSKKKWTRHERRAQGAGAALARDVRGNHPGNVQEQQKAVRSWGAWICKSGMPMAVWSRVAASAAEALEAPEQPKAGSLAA